MLGALTPLMLQDRQLSVTANFGLTGGLGLTASVPPLSLVGEWSGTLSLSGAWLPIIIRTRVG